MSGALTIVSGKGGVGKTTVASAIAQGFAEAGQNTLLVELGDTGTRHPVFLLKTEYEPQVVAPGLSVARIDSRLALREYVGRYMKFSRVYRQLLDRGPVRRLLDALPIFDELMCMGKIYDLTRGTGSTYNQVVFDGPATGHLKTLLNVPDVAKSLLLAGPIQHGAKRIIELLTDSDHARMIIVALPEDTPSREAEELAGFCRDKVGIRCDKLVVNRCFTQRFTDAELALLTKKAGRRPELERLCVVARSESEIARQQAVFRERLAGSFRDIVDIPQLSGCTTAQKLKQTRRLLEPMVVVEP